MQPSVPNSLHRSDLDGKGLLPQVTQASHSELSEADQYRGGQGGVMNVLVYRQGTTNCLVSHKTIMAIHKKVILAGGHADIPCFLRGFRQAIHHGAPPSGRASFVTLPHGTLLTCQKTTPEVIPDTCPPG